MDGKEYQGATDIETVDVSGSDAVLDRVSRAVYVGTAGDLEVVTEQGSTVTLVGVSGELNIRVKEIKNANTTATNIAIYY